MVAELNTGLRESKLLGVHRSWIREQADGWWLVLPPSHSRLKGTPPRLPLNPSARWALRDPLPSIPDGRVFRRWDDVRAFKKYWARVCDLAMIRTCTSMTSGTPSPHASKASAATTRCDRRCSAIRMA